MFIIMVIIVVVVNVVIVVFLLVVVDGLLDSCVEFVAIKVMLTLYIHAERRG